MLAQVIYTPNEPRSDQNGRFVDIKIELPNGEKKNVYAREGTDAWDVLHSVERHQIIEVETFIPEGQEKEFFRLTAEEHSRILNGRKHVANFVRDGTPVDRLHMLVDLMQEAENQLGVQPEYTEETVRKLAITAYIQD